MRPIPSLFHSSRLLALTLALVCCRLATPAPGAVANLKVTTDQSIDCSSLETIVQQVCARANARNNDQKAIAIYEWLHNTIFHWAYPTEAAPQTVGPLKVINVYGWGLCGGQHTVLKALYETAGFPCRYVGWSNPGHTTIEVQYDGRWHYFDVFLKCYFWTKDKSHVASQEEIAADPSIVLDAQKEGRAARQHLCCGDAAEDVVRGIKSRKVVGDSKGWASVTWRDQGYSPSLALPSGAALRLDWRGQPDAYAVSGKKPQHSCGTKDFRYDSVLGPRAEHYGPRNWSNGQLIYAPDFSAPLDLADIELRQAEARDGKIVASAGQGVAVFRLPLPYAWVSAEVDAQFQGGAGRLSLSTDGGKTWKPSPTGSLTNLVKQKYDLCWKAEFPGSLSRFQVRAVVEHNRGARPWLVNGKNQVTVSAGDGTLPAGARVIVSLTYQEATAPNPARRNRWEGAGLTYGEPMTVTKELPSLPATFEIEVGGNTLPRMISLESSVRSK